jgi:hypothetical protein
MKLTLNLVLFGYLLSSVFYAGYVLSKPVDSPVDRWGLALVAAILLMGLNKSTKEIR